LRLYTADAANWGFMSLLRTSFPQFASNRVVEYHYNREGTDLSIQAEQNHIPILPEFAVA